MQLERAEFWLDLTQWNTITLPATTVTDPLQGTRFHFTVHAIPELSALLVFGAGLAGLCAAVMKRRR